MTTSRTSAPPGGAGGSAGGSAGAPGLVRVLAVDALPLATCGLRALVEQTAGFAWCGAAQSVPTAVSAVRRLRPHVVLVDSALDAAATGVRALVTAWPAATVVGLVRHDHPDAAGYLTAARAAQVHGLVARSAAPGVVIAAIRAAHARRNFIDPQLVPLLGDRPAAQARPEGRVLSGRQRQILGQIARGRRNADIAEELAVSTETVRTHVKELLRRLGAQDRAHAVARGYELGLLGIARNDTDGGGSTAF